MCFFVAIVFLGRWCSGSLKIVREFTSQYCQLERKYPWFLLWFRDNHWKHETNPNGNSTTYLYSDYCHNGVIETKWAWSTGEGLSFPINKAVHLRFTSIAQFRTWNSKKKQYLYWGFPSHNVIGVHPNHHSPSARWGLLDFMSVAWSSSSSSSSSFSSSSSSRCPPPRRPPRPPPAPLRSMSVCPAGPQPRPSTSVCPAGPQPRPSAPSVPCRTSTTTIHAQCSLPDLNHDHPRPVFPARPQPRPSTPSVPCRTSTASIHAKCSLPDLM